MVEGVFAVSNCQRAEPAEKTVANIIDRFLRTGDMHPSVGRNRTGTAKTDHVFLCNMATFAKICTCAPDTNY